MATYPALAIGQRLTAALLTSMLPQTVYKTLSTARTSTAAKTADPELTLPVEANAVYELAFYLKYDAGNAGDIGWTFSTPAGTSGSYGISSIVVGGAGASQTEDLANVYTLAANAGAGGIGAGIPLPVLGLGKFVTGGTAGSITLSWAQFTSNATATTLQADSYLKITRIG